MEMKVLLIDDQAEVREFLSDFLTMQGYEVVQAANGKSGLDLYLSDKPDVAVVDVEMPVMNGLQFSQKALEYDKNFPILIITAFLQKYSREDFESLGIKSVLQKPIDLNTLNRTILTVVKN